MKRLALLTITACLFGFAASARAADPIPAPTVPTIPAPVYSGNVLSPSNSGGPGVIVQPRGPAERTPQPVRPFTSAYHGDAYEPVAQPVQPQPAVLVAAPVGSCESCRSKDCWSKVKAWFCYRQTPVKLGLTPTPYTAPLAAQFPCVSSNGCGPAGCAKDTKCAPAACGPRLGGGFPCRGTNGGCVPVAADPVMPGYRFAAPVNAHVVAPAAAPLPAVPYVAK